MADFTKKISIQVELLTGQAKRGVTDFRNAISGAEGPVNKLKAGAASLGASLRGIPFPVLAAGAAAGAAAVGKAAVDMVNDFPDVAIAAKDLGTATGLGTEAASRWIAVADDFEGGRLV